MTCFHTFPDFANLYRRAREDQADRFAAEIVAPSDQATNNENAAAVRVRVDARKWVASKLKPGTYGEKIEHSHTGEIATRNPTNEQLLAKLAQIAGRLGVVLDLDGIAGRLGIAADVGTVGRTVEAVEAVELLSADGATTS